MYWFVYWSCEHEKFYFRFVGSCRGEEVDACTWQAPPLVPEPWVVLLDPATSESDCCRFVFWNPVLEIAVEPSCSPPAVGQYFAVQKPSGVWVYIDSVTGREDPEFHPGRAPHGWVEDWCISHQSWFYRNLVTGEVSYEYPKEVTITVDASASLAALREAQLIPEVDEVAPWILRKCFRHFCLRYHPDKCADDVELYLEYKAHFEELLQAVSLVAPSAT